jgi:phosphocarrier protein HPr
MIKREIVLGNKTGFHVRPAALFAKKAHEYVSSVYIAKNDELADGRSIMQMINLGIICDCVFTIIVDGTDEKEAMNGLLESLKDSVESELEYTL